MANNETKLQHLTRYLIESLKTSVLDNKIDAWQENITLIVNGEDCGNGGIRIARWKYNSVISIESYPQNLLDPRYLLSAVACWISEHDHQRTDYGLSHPSISIDYLDDATVDVSIELELFEDIEMIPDDNGILSYIGQRYRVENAHIYIAEEFEICASM